MEKTFVISHEDGSLLSLKDVSRTWHNKTFYGRANELRQFLKKKIFGSQSTIVSKNGKRDFLNATIKVKLTELNITDIGLTLLSTLGVVLSSAVKNASKEVVKSLSSIMV